jgi:ABC-2 type transport system ATP-binding protein
MKIMVEVMVLAEDLTKQFDDFTAVDHVNLRVERGQALVLLGPNGAGKTTTVRMLTSVLRPTGGRARVAGYDILQEPEQVRASVGVLTEHHGLYGRMNAVEYLDFFGQLYGMKRERIRQRVDTLLENFGLADSRSKRLGEYSKGMRQKLALVRALLNEPPVLLLDEPTSAMDPESARVVRDAMHQLKNADRSIILCTHNLVEAEELADTIAIIRQGKIIINDSVARLKNTLLGKPEYELRLAQNVDGLALNFPAGVCLTGRGENWIRLLIEQPDEQNAAVLRYLLNDLGLPVISLQEIPFSLEQAYLAAMNRAVEEAAHA